jgi:regulator of cell morphogenesis and NO signaling
MTITAEKTVREIALESPSSIRIFEALGIDYCCGGRKPLAEACVRAKIDLATTLNLLAMGDSVTGPRTDWSVQPLEHLTAFIVDTHHGYVRNETPRIEGQFAKVLAKHGAAHPEVSQMEQIFSAMSQELATHMMKEERILFPYVEAMAAARAAGAPLPEAFFGTAERPIATMMLEHEDAGELLSKLRSLSSNYEPPMGACPTFVALYRALEDFEHDLHEHIHLENNILFPRALELERA